MLKGRNCTIKVRISVSTCQYTCQYINTSWKKILPGRESPTSGVMSSNFHEKLTLSELFVITFKCQRPRMTSHRQESVTLSEMILNIAYFRRTSCTSLHPSWKYRKWSNRLEWNREGCKVRLLSGKILNLVLQIQSYLSLIQPADRTCYSHN